MTTLRVAVLVTLVLATTAATAAMGPNRGDINGDGAITVVDINCFIGATLAAASGGATPSCQASADALVDLQCDGVISVLDVQRVILIRLHQLAPTLDIEALLRVGDSDFDGLHDGCEADTDGDGVIDDDDLCPTVPDPQQLDVDGDGAGDACDPDNCTGTVCADDGNPCTASACNPATGLCAEPLPDGTGCDADGDGCTVGDACADGVCVPGAAPDCSSLSDACNLGACVSGGPDAFACAAAPSAGPCDDGDACTSGDACSDGACVAVPILCPDDGNPCTSTTCDAVFGCLDLPNSDPCDDGEVCTANDTCAEGQCVGVPDPACQCAGTADCAQFENGNLCDGTLVCQANQCVVDPSTVKSCAPTGVPCQVAVCQPATGLCLPQTAANGASCNDEDPCTLGDICFGGSCGGTSKFCPDDGNPCVLDVCDASTGACGVTAAAGAPCDDGDLCTTGDQCAGVTCLGAPTQCADDGNPCTTDACDPATGGCGVPTAGGTPCDADGDGCTVADACDSGVCLPGAPADCSDLSDPCNVGVCAADGPEAYSCSAQAVAGPCDDGDPCTSGDACTAGTCVGAAVTCGDDGNPCTTDTCDPATGGCGVPVPSGTPCDADGDGCTQGDACVGGQCLAGPPVDCSASDDDCNVGACASTGPETWACAQDPVPLEGAPCDDGEVCTFPDTCGQGACGGATYPACEDPDGGLICLLWGQSGQTVACELHLARATEASPPAVNLQADWAWDATAASLDQLQDGEKCFTPEFCVPWLIPSSFSALQSGHSVNLDPTTPATWTGAGHMLLANVQAADVPLTEAWLEGPILHGESHVVTALFTLKKDIPASSPVPVSLSNLVMSDKDLHPLAAQALQLLLRTSPAP
ncbi:MAG: hypothetical protein AMXMBFR64_11200 [Myxococcales bacterium]